MEFCLLYLWLSMSGFLEHIAVTCALGGLVWTFFGSATGKHVRFVDLNALEIMDWMMPPRFYWYTPMLLYQNKKDAPEVSCFARDYKNPLLNQPNSCPAASGRSRKAGCLRHFNFTTNFTGLL